MAGTWPMRLPLQRCPPFPTREEDFAAYALCRLLLLHPAPLSRPAHGAESGPYGSGRYDPENLKALHETCAALLRQGKPLPTLGGQLLGRPDLQNPKGA